MPAAETRFELTGGRVCLDFANTVSRRPTPRAEDRLADYADLVAWARQAGLVTPGAARRLLERGRRAPGRARAALGAGRRLREAIYRVFSAVAGRRPPRAGDLEAVGQAVATAASRARVVPRGAGFEWAWAGEGEALDRMLWAVARSAAELLTADDLVTVRECEAPDCGWLFIDASRNRTRRWCDMRVCGNRAKARRFYARRRVRRARSAGGKS